MHRIWACVFVIVLVTIDNIKQCGCRNFFHCFYKWGNSFYLLRTFRFLSEKIIIIDFTTKRNCCTQIKPPWIWTEYFDNSSAYYTTSKRSLSAQLVERRSTQRSAATAITDINWWSCVLLQIWCGFVNIYLSCQHLFQHISRTAPNLW